VTVSAASRRRGDSGEDAERDTVLPEGKTGEDNGFATKRSDC